jgi:hypothetical protein
VIYKTRETRYMFERHDQKIIAFAFYDSFYHSFRGSKAITSLVRPSTCLRVATKNPSFSGFMADYISYSHGFKVLR